MKIRPSGGRAQTQGVSTFRDTFGHLPPAAAPTHPTSYGLRPRELPGVPSFNLKSR